MTEPTKQDYLEDNIATVAFHLGQPGTRLRVSHSGNGPGLVVDPGEVLAEISRRLTAPRSAVRIGEDWSCAADFLDDIEVDDKGMCRWSDVANAQTHIRASLRSVCRPVAEGSLEAKYHAGLEELLRYAKRIRASSKLVGPAEYAHDGKSLKVWERALYHEGKTLEGMIKAVLRGSEVHEPQKGATSALPSADGGPAI